MQGVRNPKSVVGLLVALAAAALLVGINEMSYRQSLSALSDLRDAQVVRSRVNMVFRYMLDAETGQRGYLLTGETKYLEPYKKAVADIDSVLTQLREYLGTAGFDTAITTEIERAVDRKLTEMELTVRMRGNGNEDAWKFVLTTDVGREQMDLIREQTSRLVDQSLQRTAQGYAKVESTLQVARAGIALVAAVGLLAFYLYLRQKNALEAAQVQQQYALQVERDRLEQQVEQRTATLAELATNLQQAREEERGRLARELHDELGSLLTAAKLDVSRLKARLGVMQPEVAERIQHLVETLNTGIVLKRRIIEDLRPSSLSNLGLKPALEILTREFSERSGLAITTSFDDVELDASKQLTVYRIVQEALTNIAKYAQAREVELVLVRNKGHVTVSVKDDGVGFDPKTAKIGSHGLAGMRHRVFAEGGRLHVQSSLGSGCRISAVLPSLVTADAGPVAPPPAKGAPQTAEAAAPDRPAEAS